MRPNIEFHDKIVIGEDLYRIDAQNQRLQDVLNPGNRVDYEEMMQGSDHYRFIYNKKNKCLAPTSFIGYSNQGDYVMVSIPKVILELKHECSLRGNDEINSESLLLDKGFQMLGLKYAERLLGISPTVIVGNLRYYYDPLNRSLGRSVGRPDVYLKNLSKIRTNQGEWYECLYNRSHRQLVDMQPMAKSKYEGHYWVRIPEEKILDPIGAAILDGKPPYSYINEHHISPGSLRLSLDRSGIITTLPDVKYLNEPAEKKTNVSKKNLHLLKPSVKILKLLADKRKYIEALKTINLETPNGERPKLNIPPADLPPHPGNQQKQNRMNKGTGHSL